MDPQSPTTPPEPQPTPRPPFPPTPPEVPAPTIPQTMTPGASSEPVVTAEPVPTPTTPTEAPATPPAVPVFPEPAVPEPQPDPVAEPLPQSNQSAAPEATETIPAVEVTPVHQLDNEPTAAPVLNPSMAAGATLPTALAEPPKSKAPLKRVLIGLGALVVLGLIALGLFIFLYLPSLDKVNESDLVQETVGNTTYLRPKQWKQQKLGSTTAYGNMLGRNNTSTALIAVTEGSYVNAGIVKQPDATINGVREIFMAAMSDNVIKDDYKEAFSCVSVENIRKVKGERKTEKLISVFSITADCVRDDGTFVARYDATLGDDGTSRTTGLMATKDNWEKNSAVYEKMISSIDQK